jgi:hypothetical protein
MKPVFLSILFFLGLSSMVHSQQGQRVPTNQFTGAIFSGEDYDSSEVLKNLGYAVGEDVMGVWTPTNEDVLALETGFTTYLSETTDARAEEVLTGLHEYKRQYIGVELKDQHLVFAAFDACTTASDEELLEELRPILPLDGGTCFIELLFDPTAKSFYRISIHGVA